MKRRDFLFTAAASLFAQTQRKPNIIIILADDLGYGDLSCYGSTVNKTPNLDSLAIKGVRFTDFHSSGAVCSPTRAGLMTGRYQQRAGIPAVLLANGPRDHGLNPREITVSRILKEAGYRTGIFGKWHLGYLPEFNPDKHGFDEFRGYVSGNVDYVSHLDGTGRPDWWKNSKLAPEEGYTTELITGHSVRFIEENESKPFFLYIAHEAVHSPYQGPGDPAERVPGKAPARGRKADPDVYRRMLTAMDDGVGRIIASLRKHRLERDTLVIFFSDNGATPAGSNGNCRGFKGSVWEGGHRVPAIAAWPGRIPAGRTSNELAISLDLMPTVLAAAGAAVPADHELDGVNLLPHLTFGRPLGERTLFWAHANQRAVRQGKWKLVKLPEQEPELYDLSTDMGETNNLAASKPDRVKAMLELMAKWEKEVNA